jgi:hypothetical protein
MEKVATNKNPHPDERLGQGKWRLSKLMIVYSYHSTRVHEKIKQIFCKKIGRFWFGFKFTVRMGCCIGVVVVMSKQGLGFG